MKIIKYLLFIAFIYSQNMVAQIDANSLMGLPTATNITEINAILNPQIGSIVYNLNDNNIYRYTGATNGWKLLEVA